MPVQSIRIGAPQISWRCESSYGTIVSTGPVKLIESWSKDNVTMLTVKVKSLTDDLPAQGDEVQLAVVMPADHEGVCDILKTPVAKVMKKTLTVSKDQAETTKITIEAKRFQVTRYDHWCDQENCPEVNGVFDCQGKNVKYSSRILRYGRLD